VFLQEREGQADGIAMISLVGFTQESLAAKAHEG
jgi:hypothetical protein